MKLFIVGGNMLGNIGGIINGVQSIGKGEVLLDKLGVSAGIGEVKKFGDGLTLINGGFRNAGAETSQLMYVGQEDSAAFSESALNKSKSDANKELTKMISEQEDPTVKILEYLKTDVDLKTNVASLATAAANSYDILGKINSGDGSIVSAIASLNTYLNEKILPAILNSGSGGLIAMGDIISGATTVTPITAGENISVNNTITGATTVSEPSLVSNYFESIKFEEGFASIVQNILEINAKMPTSFGALSGSMIGFTQ